MREVCSCSASLEITDIAQWSTEALLEMFEKWRENHRHEASPNHDTGGVSVDHDMPLIHESGSSHEKAIPFGFTAEPLGGWGA